MASAVKKGGKINFAKVVAPAKEGKGDKECCEGVVKAVNFNTKATNDLGKTWNSIADILLETKDAQVEAFKKMTDGAKVDFVPTFNKAPGEGPIPDEGSGEGEEQESPGGGWLMNLLGVFKDIIVLAIAGPVMKWLSDPKNMKAIKNIVGALMKFFGFVAKFLTDRVINGLEGLRKMIEGNWWEKIVGLFQLVTNFAGLFLAIRWLKNPMKLVKDLKKLFKVFAKGLKMTSKKMIKRLGVIGLLIGAGLALKEGLKGDDEEEDGDEGGTFINGNKVSEEDSIKYSNLMDRIESLENDTEGEFDPKLYEQTVRQKEELEAKYPKIPKKAAGGWIHGPQSGYPVSLDGGRSTSFIGHGTEYVAQRSRGGFVVPFDTPATRKDSGLTGRRMRQASSAGYKVPGRSEGGPVNINNFFPEIKGYAEGGEMDMRQLVEAAGPSLLQFMKQHNELLDSDPEFYNQSTRLHMDRDGKMINFGRTIANMSEWAFNEGTKQIESNESIEPAIKKALLKKMDWVRQETLGNPNFKSDMAFNINKDIPGTAANRLYEKAKNSPGNIAIKAGIAPEEVARLWNRRGMDAGGIIQPTIQPVINLMSHGGVFNPVIPTPQPMFLGGQIKKAASGVKKLATGAWNKVSSTAQGVMTKATDAVRGMKGDSKKEKQKAAMEAIMKAQELAALEEAKIAQISASSMKQVSAAKGAAASKKPTVVGGGGKPSSSLVDQLQSYNSIWK